MSKRILITGSRNWTDPWPIAMVLSEVLNEWVNDEGIAREDVVLVEGECPHGGADEMARIIWETWGLPVEQVPADWAHCDGDCYHKPRRRATGEAYCPAAGNRRNSVMVDRGADICIAFPLPESRGTWDCVRKATAAGIPVRIVEPIVQDSE